MRVNNPLWIHEEIAYFTPQECEDLCEVGENLYKHEDDNTKFSSEDQLDAANRNCRSSFIEWEPSRPIVVSMWEKMKTLVEKAKYNSKRRGRG